MKTYPFSMKNAHSIEFYHNRLFNIMCDMESGEIPMETERYAKIRDMYYGPLAELMDAIYSNRNPYVVYLTGEQIGLAKRIVFWASEQRAQKCIERGKLEYLQYC